MVKILKHGDLDRLKQYKKFTCDRCGCEFVADNTEYTDSSTQRDGPVFQILCPDCDNWVSNYSYDCVSIRGYSEER